MIDLEDLYAIDPSLREHEGELKKLLTKLERAKPDVKIDSAFVAELRRELLSRPAPESRLEKILKPMNRIPLYIGGVATIALVALIGYNLYSDADAPASTGTVALSDSTGIKNLAPGAFGPLAFVADTGVSGSGAPAGAGAAFGGDEDAAPQPQSGGSGELGIAADSKLIAPGEPYPEFHTYALEYVGGDFEIPEASGDVYRRVRSEQASARLGALMAGQDNGILDLAAFDGMHLTSYQLVQSGGSGYAVNVDLQNGQIYIGRDYARGYADAGYDRRLTESDMPADASIIATASSFLKDHGVDVSSYGQPYVQDDWRRYITLELMRDASADVWYPHVISVIFPLVVEGSVVHDQSGNPHGVNVSVNVVDGTVTGAYGITAQVYEKSAYALETDMARIVSFAERGGIYGFWLGSETGGTISLGAPETVSMLVSQWDDAARRHTELVVPAMRFTLLDPPKEASHGPRFIVVPLVKDVLDAFERGPDIDGPRPMPVDQPVSAMPVPEPGMEDAPETEVKETE